MAHTSRWPELPLAAWTDTYETLRLWTQVVGKYPLKLTPLVNHWWNTALHVDARGLSTAPMPYQGECFTLRFDFIDHRLRIETSRGEHRAIALKPKSVARFHDELTRQLGSLGIRVAIDPMPKEIPDPIPFHEDHRHQAYDAEYAHRHWRLLLESHRILSKFRGRFIGKCSPVHFFWGSFDLCVTRYSGRRAPFRPEADHITQEAYTHEVCSLGFWPGSGNIADPAFYAYAVPEPVGFSSARIEPAAAFYNPPTKGYILMLDEVRRAADPERMLLDFAESTYEAAANLGAWDRPSLERVSPPELAELVRKTA